MITKKSEVDEVIVKPDGQLGFQLTTTIYEDGVAISQTHNRGVLLPGQPIPSAPEYALLKQEADIHHTAEKVRTFREAAANLEKPV